MAKLQRLEQRKKAREEDAKAGEEAALPMPAAAGGQGMSRFGTSSGWSIPGNTFQGGKEI